MKNLFTVISFALAVPAGAAFADDDCFVPMADWQPRDAVNRLAEEKGWTVQRIKVDDGCYEIKGRDAEGRRIKVKVHPSSLEVVEMDQEDDDSHKDDGHMDDRDHARENRKGGDND